MDIQLARNLNLSNQKMLSNKVVGNKNCHKCPQMNYISQKPTFDFVSHTWNIKKGKIESVS